MGNASHVNDGEGGGSIAPAVGTSLGQSSSPVQDASDDLLTTDPAAAVTLRDHRQRLHCLRRVLTTGLLLLLLGSGLMLWLQRDAAIDWIQSRNYTAPQQIIDLAADTTMTPYGRRLFFVNYPAIEDKDDFNRNCPDASHEVAVLGCYRGDRGGIHLYHVTDARLAGITEVTAAHEMLHQAYDRLSNDEREQIGRLLDDYYRTSLKDKNVLDKMESYKKLEPADMTNEMHSVFGTEISTLPPELEAYYQRYFTDRSKVVAYRNKYVSAFSQRQEQIEQYDQRRDELKVKIDQAQTDLDTWEARLKAQRDEMNAWLAASQIEKYNAAVPGFNSQVSAYKAKVAATNELINEYNMITDKRNALTAQEKELLDAQDSHASSASAE